jgi:hypothetical protein
MLLAAGAAAKSKYGAFIQDTTGKLWTAEEWDGSATPNGIAVRSKGSVIREGILLAIVNSLSTSQFSTKYFSLEELGVGADIDSQDGYANTQALLRYSTYLPALMKCISYRFPDGQYGYLGSSFEMSLIYSWRTEIEECLTALGITFPSMTKEYVWSSTPSSTTTATTLYVIAPSVDRKSTSYASSNTRYYVWPIGKVGDWSK